MRKLSEILRELLQPARTRNIRIFSNGTAAKASSKDACLQEAAEVEIGYRHFFWIFVLFSIGGLIVETIVSYPIDGVWKNRVGFLWGPFSPIYGVGAVLMTLALYDIRHRNPLHVFLVAACVGAAFEFVAGWFFETAFGIVAWDYSTEAFNLMGHTCLRMAVVWGVAGLGWISIGCDPVIALINRVPQKLMRPLTIFLTIYMVLNVVMTLLAFNCWYQRIDGQPIDTPVQQYFAQNYDDNFMSQRFETMSLWSSLAKR